MRKRRTRRRAGGMFNQPVELLRIAPRCRAALTRFGAAIPFPLSPLHAPQTRGPPMLRPAVLMLGLAILAVPAAGLGQAVPDIPEQVFTNDPSHTTLDFGVSHLGFSTYRGRFTGVAIQLTLDPQDPARAQLGATVRLDSLQVPNPPEGFVAALLGPEWFDAGTHPEARFVSDRVEVTGPDTATVTGTLTLHGVSGPLTLQARYNGGYASHPLEPRARLGFSATGSFRRSDFGMGFLVPPAGETFGIGDEISVVIEAEMLGPLQGPPQ